ncbi:MAG: S53 family peptidase [Acidimicrobiales bacterium]
MRHRPFGRRSKGLIAVGALAIGVVPLGASAAYASTTTTQLVPVNQGIGASALAGATPLGTTSGSQSLTVSFVLQSPNLAQLEQEVANGWSGSFLSVSQFANQYGLAPSDIANIESYLGSFGIKITKVYADNLDISTTGTATQYNNALHVALQNFKVREGASTSSGTPQEATVYGTTTAPKLPANIASEILAVLGLTNYKPFASSSLPGVDMPTSGSSTNLTIPPGSHTPATFTNHYNLSPILSHGYKGQGNSVGIVTLASLDPSVPYTFWSQVLHEQVPSGKIHLVNVDGGAGAVSLNNGSDETTLDVEQSGAIAPDASVYVYQAPNTDYGFVDAFFALASNNIASSFSASWGESETFLQESVNNYTESPGYANAFNEAFAEAAAQGETGFVSSGDQAAYDASADALTTNLAVDNPGDSPYITAAGGTTLAGTQQPYKVQNANKKVIGADYVTIPQEMTWNWGYLFPMYAALGFPTESAAATTASPNLIGGSGGGYSTLFPEPTYQQGVVGSTYSAYQYLTPTTPVTKDGLTLPTAWSLTTQPALSSGSANGMRAVPDISVNADPQTGYAVYDPQFTAAYGAPIVDFGGTSFSAPQLNAAATVIDSALGHRVGFWNPLVYSLAKGANSPFTPLDSNTVQGANNYRTVGQASIAPGANYVNGNLYYTGTPGAIYNPGSGLGIPNLTTLALDLKS